jgi:nicotinate-nucleotide adenylyltransferase
VTPRARRAGLLGGTFDPIHVGHLDVAEAARRALGLDEVRLIPARVPPHRAAGAQAAAEDRLAMVRLAIQGYPHLIASDLELRAPGPSYTASTLRELGRQGWRPTQLFFIAGADAFAEIATWRDYPVLLDLAHFAVVSRPGVPAASLPGRLPALAPRMVEPGAVGDARAAGEGPTAIFLIHAATRDVSSTQIRDRVEAGASLADLVPPRVADYIRRHGLYSFTPTADDLHG